MAITKMGMLFVVVGLLAMVQQSVQIGYDTSSMLSETGNDLSYWAIVFSSKTCENTIIESGDFVLNGTEVIAGRVFSKGSLHGHPAVLVNTGNYSANVASALQIVLYHYQIQGVLYLGLAGGLNGSVAIGDVIIPKSVAFTAIWDWLSQDANPEGDLVFGNFNQGPNLENKLDSVKFDNVTLYTGQNNASSLFYLETDPEWMKKALYIKPELPDQIPVHVGLLGASSDMTIYNKDYARFLDNRFGFAAADMESAAVALVSKSNEKKYMVFHGVSYIAPSGVPPTDEGKREAATNAYLALRTFLGFFPKQRGYITTYV